MHKHNKLFFVVFVLFAMDIIIAKEDRCLFYILTGHLIFNFYYTFHTINEKKKLWDNQPKKSITVIRINIK